MLVQLRARFDRSRVAVAIAIVALIPATLVAQTVTANPTTAVSGATITVTVKDGPGNPNDWVGLFAADAPDTTYVAWQYLRGPATASGVINGTVDFVAPAAPGAYNVRLFTTGSTKVATSSPITVQTRKR
jgi:hypothetical protein